MTVLFVGELNPYGPDEEFALYPRPRGAAGDRLCRLVLGLHERTYMQLHRANLCTERWTIKSARERAKKLLLDGPSRPWKLVVALGAKVAGAFWDACFDDYDYSPIRFETVDFGLHYPGEVLYLPHPSGLNRDWNDPSMPGRCRNVLEQLAPQVPWGEALGECT